MPQRNLQARIMLSSGSDAEWQARNPVLLNGELAVVSDLHRTKTGNGSTPYKTLPFDDLNIYAAIAEVGTRAPPLPTNAAKGIYLLCAALNQAGATYSWLSMSSSVSSTAWLGDSYLGAAFLSTQI
jgi:hypothetical protein